MNSQIRNAICRIDVLLDSGAKGRGTGTLVAPGIVLTALHVVAARHENPPRSLGPITLTFPNNYQTEAVIHETALDPKQDWVLLTCKVPPPAKPIKLGILKQSQVKWETYGFPDANPRDGMIWSGKVENYEGEWDGVTTFQLFSHEAAAGDGGPVPGLSGAPVMVDGWLVGHMRTALLGEGGRSVAGTIYACPAECVVKQCPGVLAIAEVPLRQSTQTMITEAEASWTALGASLSDQISALGEKVVANEASRSGGTYCRSCGKEVSEKAVACPNCRALPLRGNKFCPHCGTATKASTIICVNCGVAVVRSNLGGWLVLFLVHQCYILLALGQEGERPQTLFLRKWLSLVAPYVGVTALLTIGVAILFKAVMNAVEPETASNLQVMVHLIPGLTLMLLGLTVASRIPRLTRSAAWRIFAGVLSLVLAVLALRVSEGAYGPQFLNDFSDTSYMIVALTLVVIVTVETIIWPGLGLKPLFVLATTMVAWVVAYGLLAQAYQGGAGAIWPVFLATPAFLYLWWLAALLFDLVFVYHSQIHMSKAADRLATVAGRQHPKPVSKSG